MEGGIFTCEGQFSILFHYHIQLLLHLKDSEFVNLFHFLWKRLIKISTYVQKWRDHPVQNV
jgi:hypothetical protein